MKILALIGSPRKGSNTDILIDEILKGVSSRKNRHRYEKLYLYDYEISPCIDCRHCKTVIANASSLMERDKSIRKWNRQT